MPEYLHPGVYVSELPDRTASIHGVSTATACFVGEARMGRALVPRAITSWSEFQRLFGDLDARHHMPLAVQHFFLNGGTHAWIVRVIDPVGATTAAVGDNQQLPRFRARGPGAWGNVTLTISRSPASPDRIDLAISHGAAVLEQLTALSLSADRDRFYADIINRDSNIITVEPRPDGTFLVPADASQVPDAPLTLTLTGGADGDPLKAISAESLQAATASLDLIDDISILAFPGVSDPHLAAIGSRYAAGRTTMIFLVDPPGGAHSTSAGLMDELKAFYAAYTPKDSYSALYFPWVEIADPYSNIPGTTRFAPPSGFIAGLYARTDRNRGVWKAPAGTEALLVGASGLALNVTDAVQDTLNPLGINCIRQFDAAGIVCWGARTLGTLSSPEYRYVPIRRLAIFLRESVYRGTRWVVLEPNDEPLWSSLRASLSAFMSRLFQDGALQGASEKEAFFVQCDATNNIQATIDAGEVHMRIGFAPLKPEELVILDIVQKHQA